MHSHFLPGMDDGPKLPEDTLAMAYIAVNEGVIGIAATHHFTDDQSISVYTKQWLESLQRVQHLLLENALSIQVYSGAEVQISPFLHLLEGIEALCINNSRYLLLELPMADIPLYTEDVIYNLRIKGIIPIIAHPERNWRILDNPNLLHPLISLGALGQITSGSITGLCRWHCAKAGLFISYTLYRPQHLTDMLASSTISLSTGGSKSYEMPLSAYFLVV